MSPSTTSSTAPRADAPDWAALRAAVLVDAPGCWTTCGGGFCCSNAHPDLALQLLPTDGTTLLYMEAEYEDLAARGEVLDTPPQRMSLDFGGPAPLTVVHLPCRLLGRCDGVITKPLLCRLYPFLPVFDVDGDLARLLPASIFEATFDAITSPTPCTVRDRREATLEQWQEAEGGLAPLRHPAVMLYLHAAGAFLDLYLERLAAHDELQQLSGRAFWQRWELAYLRGELIDTAALASRVRAFYDELEQRHGAFWPPPPRAGPG